MRKNKVRGETLRVSKGREKGWSRGINFYTYISTLLLSSLE